MSLLLLFNPPAEAPPTGSTSGTAFASFVEAGMYLGTWEIDDYLTFAACIHDDTGAAADADAVPSYAIYEDETATAIVTGDMVKLGSVAGFYTERVQLTALAGFEEGKCYAVRVAAVVGGITAAAVHQFQVEAAKATAATLALVKAKTDTIGALTVTLTAPVATSGNAITVIRGDDYLNADGRALAFTGTNWPVITGGAVALFVRFPTVTSYAGVVTGAAACYIELTDTQTALLTPGVYDYDLQATLAGVGGSVITLAQGTFTVSADVR